MSLTPNTAANGGQILTDPRIVEILIANDVGDCDPRILWYDTTSREPTVIMRNIVRAIEADLRADLVAVPASEPVKAVPKYLPPPELTWLYTHCRAIGMTCKSLSGKWEHDIALFTMSLQNEIRAAEDAAPAPVSGMPDLTKLARYDAIHGISSRVGVVREGRYLLREDVEALFPAPQAPDTPVARNLIGANDLVPDGYEVGPGNQLRQIATLPAAPAPTEQPAHETIVREGNMLTCTACGTSKKMSDPCAAPTEQAGELPPLPPAFWQPCDGWTEDYYTAKQMRAYALDTLIAALKPRVAALATPLAPTPAAAEGQYDTKLIADLYEFTRYAACSQRSNTGDFLDGLFEQIEALQPRCAAVVVANSTTGPQTAPDQAKSAPATTEKDVPGESGQ